MPDDLPQIDTRTTEILDRIKGVFAAKGFDGASMQDLARAAGMSAGNFYRYFPSKNAIIEAMVQRDLDDVARDFERVMQAPSPREALVAAIRERLEDTGENEGALWAEIEAAAARRAEISAIHDRMEASIIAYLTRAFARLSGRADADAALRFRAQAQLVVLMVRGAAVQSCGAARGDHLSPSPALHALVLRLIDQILGEIAADGDRPRNQETCDDVA